MTSYTHRMENHPGNGKALVRVLWRDISGIDSGDNSSSWFTEKQIRRAAQKLYDQQYESIGYIVAEEKDFIVIAATCDGDKEEPIWSDASMIIRSVIIRIDVLEYKQEDKCSGT